MKTCRKCKQTKAYEEFRRKRSCRDGYTGRCKLCLQEDDKNRLIELKKDPEEYEKFRQGRRYNNKVYKFFNREKVLEKARQYANARYKEDPEYWRKYQTKARAEYKKNWYQKNKERINEKNLARYHEDELVKKKHRARQKVTNAVASGALQKKDICQLCGSSEKIEAHHHDYDKPLDVIWLCRICHRMTHRTYS